jgi:hypothetical protein
VMRLISGILGWGALGLLSRAVFSHLGRDTRAFWITFLFSSFFFLPQLHVRTSSESMSTAFLMLSLAVVLKILKVQHSAPTSNHAEHTNFFNRPATLFAVLGGLLGVAFEARYQTAFAGLGLALWVFLRTPHKWACAVFGTLGGAAAILLGAFADRWGYGNGVFPAYRYAVVNLLEGKAASFGVSPWWDYFVSFRKSFVAPYGGALVVGIVLSAWVLLRPLFLLRKPAQERESKQGLATAPQLLASALASLVVPFFLIHMFMGHKENRFLYPIVWAAWLVFLLEFGIPLAEQLSKRALETSVLRPLIAVHLFLSAGLLFRNSFSELQSRAPLLKVLQRESELKQTLTLRALDGMNPYIFGCGGSDECGKLMRADFLQPDNLILDCREELEGQLQGSLALQTFTNSPAAVPSPPAGCSTLASTLPSWMPMLAGLLPENLRSRAFKNFRFHVLWDCRG